MTIEEAFERAKAAHGTGAYDDATLEFIFPQLAESEDERIRKALIWHLKADMNFVSNGVTKAECLAYLEKQKDLDKMIVVSPEVWDKAISDAFENGKKEGEKQKEQKPAEWSEEFEKNIHELLYNKLKWDSEDGRISTAVFIDDKTLKDIVTGIWFYVGKEAMKNPNMELPKQEWSNEDEEKLKAICTYLRDYSRLAKINDVKRFNAYCDWLKSLRPQPKQEGMRIGEKKIYRPALLSILIKMRRMMAYYIFPMSL